MFDRQTYISWPATTHSKLETREVQDVPSSTRLWTKANNQYDGIFNDVMKPTEDEQKLLGAAKSKDGNETTTATADDIVHQTSESILALFTRLMHVHTVRRFLGLFRHGQDAEANKKQLTVTSTSGRRFGTSAAIKCRSSCREKSPV